MGEKRATALLPVAQADRQWRSRSRRLASRAALVCGSAICKPRYSTTTARAVSAGRSGVNSRKCLGSVEKFGVGDQKPLRDAVKQAHHRTIQSRCRALSADHLARTLDRYHKRKNIDYESMDIIVARVPHLQLQPAFAAELTRDDQDSAPSGSVAQSSRRGKVKRMGLD